MDDPTRVTRRKFLGTTVGAGAGAALLGGCSEKAARYLIPYVIPPDDSVPGLSRYYRTVCRECPASCGATVRTREGRAIKLEGNPDHPASRGALCARGQAAIEGLYDPDRLGRPLLSSRSNGTQEEVGWDQAERELAARLQRCLDAHQQVWLLSRPETGSLGALFGAWLGALGQSAEQVVTFDPTAPHWAREAARRAFGVDDTPIVEFSRARMLLSIGADFLEEPGCVENARSFQELRASQPDARFVYVGPRLSLTAASADEWMSVRPGTEIDLVLSLVHLAVQRGGEAHERLRARVAAYAPDAVSRRTGLAPHVIRRIGRELDAGGLCIGPGRAVAGDNAAELAAAIYVLDALSGSLGHAIGFLQPAEAAVPAGAPLSRLIEAAADRQVGALLVHHADPFHFADALPGFEEAARRIGFIAAFGNELDDTARRARLVLPDHHFLESWGDLSVRPGVTGIQQPAMTPVRETRAAPDVLIDVMRRMGKTSVDIPEEGDFGQVLRSKYSTEDLARGGVFVEAARRTVSLVDDPLPAQLGSAWVRGPRDWPMLVLTPSLCGPEGPELLNEIPDPVTTISWSGWAELHPRTARRLGAETGDVVRLESRGATLELPAYVWPGIREDAVAVPASFASALYRTGLDPTFGLVGPARVVPLGRRAALAIAPDSQQGRGLALESDDLDEEPPHPHRALSIVPQHEHPEHRWGLVVDLDRCTGCGACIAACQIENNSPVVGPEQTALNRRMSWLRVDRFLEGTAEEPVLRFLPVMCQHCCKAPCEIVCPAYATYHTDEGINAQIYNRCVGTRYCENNCPYQVRSFNWFDWHRPRPANLSVNPDVVVRERGVSEKCSFCIQRIRAVEEQAKFEGRPIRDGEVAPACAQTCPSRALVFGDLADHGSEVSRLHRDPRAYRLLEHLNTEPGVTYLARRRRRRDRA